MADASAIQWEPSHITYILKEAEELLDLLGREEDAQSQLILISKIILQVHEEENLLLLAEAGMDKQTLVACYASLTFSCDTLETRPDLAEKVLSLAERAMVLSEHIEFNAFILQARSLLAGQSVLMHRPDLAPRVRELLSQVHRSSMADIPRVYNAAGRLREHLEDLQRRDTQASAPAPI